MGAARASLGGLIGLQRKLQTVRHYPDSLAAAQALTPPPRRHSNSRSDQQPCSASRATPGFSWAKVGALRRAPVSPPAAAAAAASRRCRCRCRRD